MNAVLDAPSRTRGRDHAERFLAEIETDLNQVSVIIRFEEGSRATSSFVDELVRIVLVERHAFSMEIQNLSPAMQEVAAEAGEHFGVSAQLHLTAGD